MIEESNDDMLSRQWIMANTRPCPRCQVRIEKSGGCNEVGCRCGYLILWDQPCKGVPFSWSDWVTFVLLSVAVLIWTVVLIYPLAYALVLMASRVWDWGMFYTKSI